MEQEQIKSDKSREGLTGPKLAQLWQLWKPEFNYAIVKVSKFSLIDIAKINEELRTNIKAVILDVDECIAPHHGEILQENIDAIIKMVKQGIQVCIFSNMKASERYQPLIDAVLAETNYEIKLITSPYAKPDHRGFGDCKEKMKLKEGEEIAMIGDNPMTDGGALQAGMHFIKVEPIQTEEGFFQTLKRSPQTITRRFYTGVSNLDDRFLGRKVLKDDFFLNS